MNSNPKLSITTKKVPWQQKELQFSCTQCGQCCTGSPGYAWVSEEEIIKIADYLSISLQECIERYIRTVGERMALKELLPRYDCIFLKDNKCQIYPVRPIQCQTFPWWVKNLHSKENWEIAAQTCPGIIL